MRPYVATRFGIRKLRPSGYFATVLLGLAFFLFSFNRIHAQCAMACRGKINISLAEYCQAVLTPSQILTKGVNCPDARFRVDILDYNMKPIPTNPVITEDYLGKTIIASVYDSTSTNSCWTHVLVEEKNAPIVLCRKDTVYCNDSIIYSPPVFYDYCDPHPTIKKTWESHTNFSCDRLFIKLIVQAWVAQDSRGNVSWPCIDSIWLRRAEIDSVVYPKNWTIANNCSIECNAIYPKDSEGHPHPDYTGYPSIGGNYLLPSYNAYCNLSVTYEDLVIHKTTCKTKILRLWRVVEWWCGTANTRAYQQIIEIADTKGPEILHCPYDFTVSTTTSYKCQAKFNLPEIEVKDACQDSLHYEIFADGIQIAEENGGEIILSEGYHDVEYRVYDACYNSSSCRVEVIVEDRNPPVAVCDQGIVVSLSRNDTTHVYAEVFDDGSHDECHLDSFLVRRMDNDAPCQAKNYGFRPYVEFCCEDVGKKVMVVFRVKDKSGNANDCMVEVEVQDKTPPVISCPHDYRMPCTDHLDTVDLSRFGSPTYSDNCIVHMHEYVDTFLNQCGIGYLRRNFVIEDNMQRRDTCSQRIYVYNPYPFREEQIVWPRDTTIFSCGGTVKPEELPDGYNYPQFLNVHCSLPGHNYVDDVFNYIEDSSLCFKVLRRWTVIDWCQEYYDSVTQTRSFATWTHLQLIKVANKKPPTINERCDSIKICVNGTNCAFERVRIQHSATDDCTPSDLIRSSFKLDLYNNGYIDSIHSVQGNVINWDGDLPLGTHRFIWVFEDQCGNFIACDQIVQIVNCKIPTAYCLTGIAVNIGLIDIDSDGKLEKLIDVWASDINHNSAQICGNPVTLSFSRDTNDKYRRFTCDSLGQRRVTLWVTDRITGLQDQCISTITVQDNNQNCRGNLTSGRIAGLVKTPDGREIQSSLISIEDDLNITEQSTSSNYAFNNLPLGKNYKVHIKNDQDYLFGVSTQDIVKIQRHILGKEIFKNVWQYLAADVTNDEKITTSDIVALRKLILGVDQKLKNSMSWRYTVATYQFPDPENPWFEIIPDSYFFPSIPGEMNYTDFVGVKMGDVSESSWSGSHSVTTRNNQSVTLRTERISKNLVRIVSLDPMEISGIQFTLKFDAGVNSIEQLYSNILHLDPNHINYRYSSEGLILVSWNSDETIKISEGQELLRIQFADPVEADQLSQVFITSDVLAAEAYDEHAQIITLRQNGPSTDNSKEDITIGYPIPNPFSDATTINLESRNPVEYQFQITDLNGQVVLKNSGTILQGKDILKIKGSSLQTPGIYLLRIEAAGTTKTFRLVRIGN